MIALLIAQATNVAGTLDHSTPIQNWQVVSAFLLPLVMAVIIQSHWSKGLQAAATMAVSMLWTLVYQLLSDQSIVVPELVIRGLELFALTIPMYVGLWKNTGVPQAIEAKTTLRR